MRCRKAALSIAVALVASFSARSFGQPATPGPFKAVGSVPVVKAKGATEISSNVMLGSIGDTVPLNGTLKARADGKSIAGKLLHFRVAGMEAGTGKTDDAGKAKTDYKVPNSPPPGPTPVEIRFEGDDDWLASSASANFAVLKSSTKLTLEVSPASAINVGEHAQIGGQLSRITDHQAVDGREVHITINGSPAGKATTTSGSFFFDYTVPQGFGRKGNVEAHFDGDVLYDSSVAAAAFSVIGPLKQGYLSWGSAQGKVGENITLTAMLSVTTIPTAGIPGTTVRFFMNRDARWPAPHDTYDTPLCQGKASASAQVTCVAKLPAPAMGRTLFAYADVNREEWTIAPTEGATIEIFPSPVHLALTGPPSARIGSKISITVKLTRTSDGGPIPDAPVLLGVANKKTNTSGDAVFDFTVESSGGTGPRTFKAVYGGQAQAYEKGDGTTTINVLPSVN